MKVVKQGETVSRSTRVEGEVVVKHHVTQHQTLGDVEVTWKFDFTDVTHEQLLELASRDLVIKARPQFKKLKAEEAEKWDGKVFSVKEMLESQRATVDNLTKATRAVEKMSPEELEQLKKLLLES